jgi:hypothetical protein
VVVGNIALPVPSPPVVSAAAVDVVVVGYRAMPASSPPVVPEFCSAVVVYGAMPTSSPPSRIYPVLYCGQQT